MRIIDLLNKIANGEEVPKKITLDKKVFQFNKTYEQYHDKYENNLLEHISDYNYSGLNDEVEVIEDNKKIEKLDIELSPDDGDKVNGYLVCEVTRDIAFKINEIIEVLNEKD